MPDPRLWLPGERRRRGYGLWIDALCIDQSDAEERMHQVRIMARIFGGAREVLVWLGLGNHAVDDMMCRLPPLGRPVELEWGDKHMAALGGLCARSYWSRLWMFQELKAAREVTLMYGAHAIPWVNLKSLLEEVAKIGSDTIDWPRSASGVSEPVARVQRKVHRRATLSAARRTVGLCGGGTPTSLWLLLQMTGMLRSQRQGAHQAVDQHQQHGTLGDQR